MERLRDVMFNTFTKNKILLEKARSSADVKKINYYEVLVEAHNILHKILTSDQMLTLHEHCKLELNQENLHNVNRFCESIDQNKYNYYVDLFELDKRYHIYEKFITSRSSCMLLNSIFKHAFNTSLVTTSYGSSHNIKATTYKQDVKKCLDMSSYNELITTYGAHKFADPTIEFDFLL